MCTLVMGTSVLVCGLGEVSRVLTDGHKTPWYCFLNPGTLVIGNLKQVGRFQYVQFIFDPSRFLYVGWGPQGRANDKHLDKKTSECLVHLPEYAVCSSSRIQPRVP